MALPLLPALAKQLIALAEQAPYGQGTEALTDTNVRRTWQVGAEKVHLTGKGWEKIRHGGAEIARDLHQDERSEVAFAAYYADHIHEVRPITQGHRLTLISNLVASQPETDASHLRCSKFCAT